MIRHLTAALAAFVLLFTAAASAQEADPDNTLIMKLDNGEVVIRLRPDLAPNHVERIKKLTRSGFYDDTPFHRVIEGFMAQGGDPTGTGTGGSDQPDLQAEFTNTNFTRGTIGAARTSDPNTANSQFFICFEDCSFLNGQYTVWGEVVEGMELVDSLKRGEPVADPDRIVMMQIAGDTN
ncbi:MAG: peptidylprolyl isomerase [Hyphomicrobiales bacterium]|nr:peptidylprolyl isomerase [Hyphomicrobiales bacterium]